MLFSFKKKHPERIAGQTVAVLDNIYLSRASEFSPEFWLGSCYSIFSLMCMFYLRILITPFDIFKLFLYISIQDHCRYVHFQGWITFCLMAFSFPTILHQSIQFSRRILFDHKHY